MDENLNITNLCKNPRQYVQGSLQTLKHNIILSQPNIEKHSVKQWSSTHIWLVHCVLRFKIVKLLYIEFPRKAKEENRCVFML